VAAFGKARGTGASTRSAPPAARHDYDLERMRDDLVAKIRARIDAGAIAAPTWPGGIRREYTPATPGGGA